MAGRQSVPWIMPEKGSGEGILIRVIWDGCTAAVPVVPFLGVAVSGEEGRAYPEVALGIRWREENLWRQQWIGFTTDPSVNTHPVSAVRLLRAYRALSTVGVIDLIHRMVNTLGACWGATAQNIDQRRLGQLQELIIPASGVGFADWYAAVRSFVPDGRLVAAVQSGLMRYDVPYGEE